MRGRYMRDRCCSAGKWLCGLQKQALRRSAAALIVADALLRLRGVRELATRHSRAKLIAQAMMHSQHGRVRVDLAICYD